MTDNPQRAEPARTRPTPDFQLAIKDLIALWERHIREPTVEVRADVHRAMNAAMHSLAAHAVDCSRAVLRLYETDLSLPAAPIVRVLMEDAILMAWLVVKDDGWKSLVNAGADQRIKLLKEAQQHAPDDADLLRQIDHLQELREESGPISGFLIKQQAEALEGTDTLYMHYRAATGLSHAGTAIIDAYTAIDEQAPSGMAWREQAHHPLAAPLLGDAAGSLARALIAYDLSLPTRLYEVELNALADCIGVARSIAPRPPRQGAKPPRPHRKASP